ncbi:two-component system QseEF-associated lipoprotein QseG [Pantoea sp. 1.19]|uniref:two-component system QseEF-associated lipoprotein QseG n=1 Tax=Pantoea sp. 1.19 TaxID=1925589 RepID=UPI0009F9BF90|nr:two-component system QseEF-associated lipoprotein QseG [Pantoea sp. 1.19]
MKSAQWFQGLKLPRCAAIAITLLLVGCQQAPAPRPAPVVPMRAPVSAPPVRVVDYLAAPCEGLWSLAQPTALDNPLYWLRATECAARLSPAEARATARQLSDDGWPAAFRRGILLSNGNVAPTERRDYMTAVDAESVAIPRPVRPMWQLWRDNQQAQLQLSEARSRYAALQTRSDTQLDALRQQQITLRHDLAVTRRKLEGLTDIERQLSARKPADLSDAPRGADAGPVRPTADAGSPHAAEGGHPEETPTP